MAWGPTRCRADRGKRPASLDSPPTSAMWPPTSPPCRDVETPDAIVSYDARGGYGHPDHIRAHDAARQAAEVYGVPFYAISPGRVDVDRGSILPRRDHRRRHDGRCSTASGRRSPPTAASSPSTVTRSYSPGASGSRSTFVERYVLDRAARATSPSRSPSSIRRARFCRRRSRRRYRCRVRGLLTVYNGDTAVSRTAGLDRASSSRSRSRRAVHGTAARVRHANRRRFRRRSDDRDRRTPVDSQRRRQSVVVPWNGPGIAVATRADDHRLSSGVATARRAGREAPGRITEAQSKGPQQP